MRDWEYGFHPRGEKIAGFLGTASGQILELIHRILSSQMPFR